MGESGNRNQQVETLQVERLPVVPVLMRLKTFNGEHTMKKQIEFGLHVYTVVFILIDYVTPINSKYTVKSIVDENGRELSASDMMTDHMQIEMGCFGRYLEALIPSWSKTGKPEPTSFAEAEAAKYDDGIDEVRDACRKCYGSGIEPLNEVGFEEECDECDGQGIDLYGEQSFNPFEARSHTAYWNGNIALISTTF